jgi:hypothetical protein
MGIRASVPGHRYEEVAIPKSEKEDHQNDERIPTTQIAGNYVRAHPVPAPNGMVDENGSPALAAREGEEEDNDEEEELTMTTITSAPTATPGTSAATEGEAEEPRIPASQIAGGWTPSHPVPPPEDPGLPSGVDPSSGGIAATREEEEEEEARHHHHHSVDDSSSGTTTTAAIERYDEEGDNGSIGSVFSPSETKAFTTTAASSSSSSSLRLTTTTTTRENA